jgi:hypothetical protein
MRGLSLRKGIAGAAEAGVVSPAAVEIGLSGWMALKFFSPRLNPASPSSGFSCKSA